MNEQPLQRTVQAGDVVTVEYTLWVDGLVVDSSEQNGPLTYIHGVTRLIPGLEKAIEGMALGENKEVVVPPEEGYGYEDPEAYLVIPRHEFPAEIPAEPGTLVQVRDIQGQMFPAVLQDVTEERVVLNLNHPLAGKTLHFSLKVVGLREATPEELAHGHVHE